MQDQDLTGKSFDQQMEITGGQADGIELAPNRRIDAEVVFEPLGSGVRVTARDEKHRVLWGYIASQGTVRQRHCLVATYSTLQDLVAEELSKASSTVPDDDDPIVTANLALDSLEKMLKWLRDGLAVDRVSEATRERAQTIARIVGDAERQITLEASTLRGMKAPVDSS